LSTGSASKEGVRFEFVFCLDWNDCQEERVVGGMDCVVTFPIVGQNFEWANDFSTISEPSLSRYSHNSGMGELVFLLPKFIYIQTRKKFPSVKFIISRFSMLFWNLQNRLLEPSPNKRKIKNKPEMGFRKREFQKTF
jgi:hypothetical protein